MGIAKTRLTGKMARPVSHYENLWEDLMQYSSFRSTQEVIDQNDIKGWFKSVDQTTKDKGRRAIFAGHTDFQVSMAEALRSLMQKGVIRRRRAPKEIKPAPKGVPLKDIGRELIWQEPGGLELVKARVVIKGRPMERWRNRANGRFAKAPEE